VNADSNAFKCCGNTKVWKAAGPAEGTGGVAERDETKGQTSITALTWERYIGTPISRERKEREKEDRVVSVRKGMPRPHGWRKEGGEGTHMPERKGGQQFAQ